MSTDRTRPVVVGIDESPAAAAALRWALDWAARTGAGLRAVHAWVSPAAEVYADAASLRQASLQDARARATRALQAAVPGGAAPELEVVEGAPGPALVAAARTADLLVLGTGVHTGVRRALQGSISHYCVTHAPCPVVTVPAPATVPEPVPGQRPVAETVGPLY